MLLDLFVPGTPGGEGREGCGGYENGTYPSVVAVEGTGASIPLTNQQTFYAQTTGQIAYFVYLLGGCRKKG